MSKKTISILREGGVGVLPTDTLYGLVGSAWNESAVRRIFELKSRDENKPVIVLISDIADLPEFGVLLDEVRKKFLNKVWPGPVSVILRCADKKFNYLHRGSGGIAFRLPAPPALRDFLRETGPLVAPSANPEGALPAETIAEAKNYFSDNVDFYEDGGTLSGPSSHLISFVGAEFEVLRKGGVGDLLRLQTSRGII